jgi:ketosteroid isomerase-like protein
MTDFASSVAEAFARAINRQDVDALAELMTLEHRFTDSLGNELKGKDAMQAAWAGYFRMVPDSSITIDETVCDGAVVVMLGIAQGTYAVMAERKWTSARGDLEFARSGARA